MTDINRSLGRKMKKWLKAIIKISGAGICAIIALSLFAFVYEYTGVHIKNESGATDSKSESYEWHTTMSEGFAWVRMNKDGFNNLFDLKEKPDILLMGSSHMCAYQVSQNENMGAILNKQLDDMITYNIGYTGHNLYYCVDNLEAAVDEYQPEKYVIIETMDVDLDTDTMEQVILKERPRQISYTGGSYYMEKYIPGAAAIWNHISTWKHTSALKAEESVIDEEWEAVDEQYEAVLDGFLEMASDAVKNTECRLIIFYHPNLRIAENGELIYETNEDKLQLFEEKCEEKGILFIDMTDDIEEMYATKHILPNGFSNTAVGAGHLNKYGHQLMADRICQVIEEDLQKR